MSPTSSPTDRRRFLNALSLASLAALAPRGAFAQQLMETAQTTEGPFYPDRLPLDTDNDLLILNDAITPAVGEITHLTGRVVTPSGHPVRNAIVEIWQTDADGSYIHTAGRQAAKPYDGNFQGYGRFLSDAKGQYYFRTIKPVEYTLQGMHRCPHIHVAVSQSGRRIFTSQFLIKGHPSNAGDTLVRRLDPKALQTIAVDFTPLPGTKLAELSANVDIVLGRTFNELQPASKDSLKGTAKGLGMPRGRN
jgi:protocatechuate 3,4-dioxygenase, beta subunit